MPRNILSCRLHNPPPYRHLHCILTPTETEPMATFNPKTFLKQAGRGKSTLSAPKKRMLFSQGDAADAVFYIQAGTIKRKLPAIWIPQTEQF